MGDELVWDTMGQDLLGYSKFCGMNGGVRDDHRFLGFHYLVAFKRPWTDPVAVWSRCRVAQM